MKMPFVFPLVLAPGRRRQRARPGRPLQLRQVGELRGVQNLQMGRDQRGAQLSDLVDRQIKAGVDAELAKKGLTKSDSDTADLYIGYQAAVGQEKEYTSFDTRLGLRTRLVRRAAGTAAAAA